jgi:undecaprenyl-diphosphatase
MDSATNGAVMGLLQGLTEFLPVSSDGHLAAYALVARVPEMSLSLVVLLHTGTLLATLLVLAPEIRQLIIGTFVDVRDPEKRKTSVHARTAVSVIAATFVTGIVGLSLKHAVEAWVSVPSIVALGFLLSAVGVASTRWTGGSKDTLALTPSLLLGLAQGLAVAPGLSRSGTTIAFAMAMGMNPAAAFRLSFLLSIPAVAGAILLDVLKTGSSGWTSQAMIGASVAFVTGFVALRMLRGLVARGQLWWFALYLVPLSLAMFAHGFARGNP